MSTPKVGDKVRILSTDRSGMFSVGDVGVVIPLPDMTYYSEEDGQVFVDFNNQGNPRVFEDGQWFIQPSTGAACEVIN